MLKIGLAADHAGFDLKCKILEVLEKLDYELVDYGTNSAESVDYPDMVHPLAKDLDAGMLDLGLIFCGSGNGVNITANKYANVRSALCWTAEIAALARQHNNANCVAFPARFISEDEGVRILNAFLNSHFEGGRHQKRVDKIPC